MITVNLKYKHKNMAIDIHEWLKSNIGEMGIRYYTEPNVLIMEDIGDDVVLPTRHFSVTFDYEEDATAFKMRWL